MAVVVFVLLVGISFGTVPFSLTQTIAWSFTFVGIGIGLIGDRSLRQEYSKLLARQVALNRILDYLAKLDLFPDIDSEFYCYQQELVRGQLKSIDADLEKLQKEYPQLRSLAREQLQATLLDIEADTYAEFIRTGRLNENLSPERKLTQFFGLFKETLPDFSGSTGISKGNATKLR